MRPKSIVLFEQLYLLAITIEVVRLAIEWPLLLRASASGQWVRVAAIGVSLLLVVLTSRRRGRVAGWILAALFLIGLPMVAEIFLPSVAPEIAIAVAVQLLLQAVALVLLFRPESRAWFAGKDEITAA